MENTILLNVKQLNKLDDEDLTDLINEYDKAIRDISFEIVVLEPNSESSKDLTEFKKVCEDYKAIVETVLEDRKKVEK